MKMKFSVILLLGIVLFAGCTKDIQLTIPTILTAPLQPGTLDTVKSSLVASASTNDESFRPDSCQWQVLDDANVQVAIISGPSDTIIYWVPQHAGDYRIIAKAFMGKNSVTANAQVHVQNTASNVQRHMIGKWQGTVTTPWIAPYQVTMEFFSNGQYSAHSMIGSPSVALYNGTDADSPVKTYRIISLDAAGANGKIVVLFDIGTTTEDDLRAINLSNNNNSLKFEMWHLSNYGPLKFDLTRQ